MVGQPLVVKLIFFTCFGAFVVSFAVAFWVIVRVLSKTDCLVDKPQDQGLSWRERQARRRSRFDRYYVAEEFRSLRKAAAIAQAGCALSFGSLLLLGLLFGERASH
ncbi:MULTISPECIES: hypothetical protein [Rhizobium]|uniref:hypothetical protein n=1 Tax=Rhizobium TaxID=379 RepID=UPI0014413869|nr:MULTISPECIES: hypothetical protein [Rhizobium]MBY3346874.1 hypothetical protein [Rhizobium laguerreae]MBY3353835.1 hypothetical protein [Rhizobium laguerreae]MBY3374881.1 hypothetical protein [Rhizobium laguerreae]MBY3430111.1 hypothetical protein [Rhizobium laguerreae]MBY3438758.1 hypothetical protein [Rhizobium laguerreae]